MRQLVNHLRHAQKNLTPSDINGKYKFLYFLNIGEPIVSSMSEVVKNFIKITHETGCGHMILKTFGPNFLPPSMLASKFLIL